MIQVSDTLAALDQLEEYMGEKGIKAPMVTLWTVTRPGMLVKHRKTKEANPYVSGVERRAQRYGQIGCRYASCKTTKLLRAGMIEIAEDGTIEEYDPEPLWGGAGEYVPESRILIRHKVHGGLYIAFRPREKPKDGSIMLGHDEWFDVATGKLIEKPDADLFKDKGEKKEGDQPWRTIKLENIVQIDCGQTWRIAA